MKNTLVFTILKCEDMEMPTLVQCSNRQPHPCCCNLLRSPFQAQSAHGLSSPWGTIMLQRGFSSCVREKTYLQQILLGRRLNKKPSPGFYPGCYLKCFLCYWILQVLNNHSLLNHSQDSILTTVDQLCRSKTFSVLHFGFQAAAAFTL